MVEINGKEYKINKDITLGTQELLLKIKDDPDNIENMKYIRYILKDILIPSPTNREIFVFRTSDIERIMNLYNEDMSETNKDFKKKTFSIVRGIPFKDPDLYTTKAILMSHYHQPYSEIKDIPFKTVLFLINLYKSEAEYKDSEIKKIKSKIPKRGKKI